MKAGAVLVDIAIDQGGCFKNSRPRPTTTRTFHRANALFCLRRQHASAVPRTSTFALTNATMPYVLRLAGPKVGRTPAERFPHRQGSVHDEGRLLSHEVAHDLGQPFTDPASSWSDRVVRDADLSVSPDSQGSTKVVTVAINGLQPSAFRPIAYAHDRQRDSDPQALRECRRRWCWHSRRPVLSAAWSTLAGSPARICAAPRLSLPRIHSLRAAFRR